MLLLLLLLLLLWVLSGRRPLKNQSLPALTFQNVYTACTVAFAVLLLLFCVLLLLCAAFPIVCSASAAPFLLLLLGPGGFALLGTCSCLCCCFCCSRCCLCCMCCFCCCLCCFVAAAAAGVFRSLTVEKPTLAAFDLEKSQLQIVMKFTGISKKALKTPPKFHEKTPERAQRDFRGAALLGPRVSAAAFAVVFHVCAAAVAVFGASFATFADIVGVFFFTVLLLVGAVCAAVCTSCCCLCGFCCLCFLLFLLLFLFLLRSSCGWVQSGHRKAVVRGMKPTRRSWEQFRHFTGTISHYDETCQAKFPCDDDMRKPPEEEAHHHSHSARTPQQKQHTLAWNR